MKFAMQARTRGHARPKGRTMETFIIILTTIVCTVGLTVSIWTIREARKRYPNKSGDGLNDSTALPTQLPEEVEIRLQKLAKRTGRSKNFYARKAIRAYMDYLDDVYLAEQAAQRTEGAEQRTSSLVDVDARLGSAD